MFATPRTLIVLVMTAFLPFLTSAFVLIEGGTDSITIDRLDDGRGYGKSRVMEKETHYFRVKREEPGGFAVVAECRTEGRGLGTRENPGSKFVFLPGSSGNKIAISMCGPWLSSHVICNYMGSSKGLECMADSYAKNLADKMRGKPYRRSRVGRAGLATEEDLA